MHVEQAQRTRICESSKQQGGWNHRHQLQGPLEQVHVRVNTTGLLQVDLGLAGWLEEIEWTGTVGEEPEGIEV